MTRTIRNLSYLITFMPLFGMLYSCAVSGLPSAKDYGSVRSGKRSIVLLRITCEIGGKPYEVFEHWLMDDNIGLALGGFETGGRPRQILPVFLSNQTRKAGWLYLLLEPGLHYLAVQPPRRSDVRSYANGFKTAPLWRLDIPSKTGLVYIGTLHLPSIKQNLLFGITIASFISDSIVVRNEEDSARRIAADFFPELETFKTMLMELHEGPLILKLPDMN